MTASLKTKNKQSGTNNYSNLIDIGEISVDSSKKPFERMVDYIKSIKDPYLFRVEDTVVRVSYDAKGTTFEEAISKGISRS